MCAARRYTFYAGGDPIARVRRAPELPGMRGKDNYAVEVAAGVDAAAILICAVIIDEDKDEKDDRRQREKEKEGGGFWPF